MQALYHLRSERHTLWLTNTTQIKGKRCVWHVAGTDTSCNATSRCQSRMKWHSHWQTSLVPVHTQDEAKYHQHRKRTRLQKRPLVFWMLNASGQGFRLYPGCGEGFGAHEWLWLEAQGDHPVLQQPNPPLLTCTHNELLPWLCFHTLRRLSSRKMSLFFLYLLWGRARTHTCLKEEAMSKAATKEKGCRDLLWSCCLQSPPRLQKKKETGSQNETHAAWKKQHFGGRENRAN